MGKFRDNINAQLSKCEEINESIDRKKMIKNDRYSL